MVRVGVIGRQVAAADALDLGAHLPSEREEVHLEVAAERPERVLERRGLVLLEDEVADPRRAVPDDGRQEQPTRG